MSVEIHNHLLKKTRKRHPRLHQIIKQNGVIKLSKKRNSEFFNYMAKTVTGQQLSNRAAATIWERIQQTSASRNSSIYDLFNSRNEKLLRKCGLSGNKIRAITGLREAIENRQISALKLSRCDHQLIISEISKLWGFGSWSAEMITLFFFAREDVWSPGDAALQRGIKLLAENNEKEIQAMLETSSPYRSYLSLHIWKALDTKIL